VSVVVTNFLLNTQKDHSRPLVVLNVTQLMSELRRTRCLSMSGSSAGRVVSTKFWRVRREVFD